MNKVISDYELVMKYIKGDQSCFEQLIRRHKNKIFSYINLYIHDQALAEDIFQDTWLKVVQSIRAGKYSDNGKFISWVMRIAHDLIIAHFRRIRQMTTISNDNYESNLINSKKFSSDSGQDDVIRQQIQKDVREMISNLPDDQREVVILRQYAGLSFKEIADITDVSINTSLGRMRQAIINLRKKTEISKTDAIYDKAILDLNIDEEISHKGAAYFIHLLSELYYAKVGHRLSIKDAYILQTEPATFPVKL